MFLEVHCVEEAQKKILTLVGHTSKLEPQNSVLLYNKTSQEYLA